MGHILSAEQFDPNSLNDIFERTYELANLDRRELIDRHIGSQLITFFYASSTRTRISFELAARSMGVGVTSVPDAEDTSSVFKGETIEDTARVLNNYEADIVVMRTKVEGDTAKAAAASDYTSIINGGDGSGEHPTQALLDAYTIQDEFGGLDGLNIVFGGDLRRGITVRSLTKLLANFGGNQFKFVSIPELQIGQDIKNRLDEHDIEYEETTDKLSALSDADVVYWTRLQSERPIPGVEITEEIINQFKIDAAAMEVMPHEAIVMHPLPRDSKHNEIDTAIDHDPRIKMFDQAGNGKLVRAALIDMILSEEL